MIGGALAKPVDAFPSIFAPGSIWDRYPYLLPNLFSAICVFMGLVVGILFLEETHVEKKHNRDRGVELGRHILTYFQRRRPQAVPGKGAEEAEALLHSEEQLPSYLSQKSGRRLPSSALAAL